MAGKNRELLDEIRDVVADVVQDVMYTTYGQNKYNDRQPFANKDITHLQNINEAAKSVQYSDLKMNTGLTNSQVSALKQGAAIRFDTETIGQMDTDTFNILELAVQDQAGQLNQYFLQMTDAARDEMLSNIQKIRNGQNLGKNAERAMMDIKRMSGISLKNNKIVSNYKDLQNLVLDASQKSILDAAEYATKLMSGAFGQISNLQMFSGNDHSRTGHKAFLQSLGLGSNDTMHIAYNGRYDRNGLVQYGIEGGQYIDPLLIAKNNFEIGRKGANGKRLWGYTQSDVADFLGIKLNGAAHVGLNDTAVLGKIADAMYDQFKDQLDLSDNNNYTIKKDSMFTAKKNHMIDSNPNDYITDKNGKIIDADNNKFWDVNRGLVQGRAYQALGQKTVQTKNGTMQYYDIKDMSTGAILHKAGTEQEMSEFFNEYLEQFDNMGQKPGISQLKKRILDSKYKMSTLENIFGQNAPSTLFQEGNKAIAKNSTRSQSYKQLKQMYDVAKQYQEQYGYSDSEINAVLNTFSQESVDNLKVDKLMGKSGTNQNLTKTQQASNLLGYLLKNRGDFSLTDDEYNDVIQALRTPDSLSSLYHLKEYLSGKISGEAKTRYAKGIKKAPEINEQNLRQAFSLYDSRRLRTESYNENGRVKYKVNDQDYVNKFLENQSEYVRDALTGKMFSDKLSTVNNDVVNHEAKGLGNKNSVLTNENTIGYQLKRMYDAAANSNYDFSHSIDEKAGLINLNWTDSSTGNTVSKAIPLPRNDGTIAYNGQKIANFQARRWSEDNGVTMWDAPSLIAKSYADFVANEYTSIGSDGKSYRGNTFNSMLTGSNANVDKLQSILNLRGNEALGIGPSQATTGFSNDVLAHLGLDGDWTSNNALAVLARSGLVNNVQMFADNVRATKAGQEAIKNGDTKQFASYIESLARQFINFQQNPDEEAKINSNLSWMGSNPTTDKILTDLKNTAMRMHDITNSENEGGAYGLDLTNDAMKYGGAMGTIWSNIFSEINTRPGASAMIGRTLGQSVRGIAAPSEEANKMAQQLIQSKKLIRNRNYTDQEQRALATMGISNPESVYDKANMSLYQTFATSDQEISDALKEIARDTEYKTYDKNVVEAAKNMLDSGYIPSVENDSAIFAGTKKDMSLFKTTTQRNRRLSEKELTNLLNQSGYSNKSGLTVEDTIKSLVSGGDPLNLNNMSLKKNFFNDKNKLSFQKGDILNQVVRNEDGTFSVTGSTSLPSQVARVMLSQTKTTNMQLGNDAYDEGLFSALKRSLFVKRYGENVSQDLIDNTQFLVGQGTNKIKGERKVSTQAAAQLETLYGALEKAFGDDNATKNKIKDAVNKQLGYKVFENIDENGRGNIANNIGSATSKILEGDGLKGIVDNIQKSNGSWFKGKNFLFDPDNIRYTTAGVTQAYDYYDTGDKYKWSRRSQKTMSSLSDFIGDYGLANTIQRSVDRNIEKSPESQMAQQVADAMYKTAGVFEGTEAENASSSYLDIVTENEALRRAQAGIHDGYISANELGSVMRVNGQVTGESLEGTIGKINEAISKGGYSGARFSLENPITDTYEKYDGTKESLSVKDLYMANIDRSDYDPSKVSLTSAEQGELAMIEAMQSGDAEAIERAGRSYIQNSSNSVFNKDGSLYDVLNNPVLGHAGWGTARALNDSEKVFEDAGIYNFGVLNSKDFTDMLMNRDSKTGELLNRNETIEQTLKNLAFSKQDAASHFKKTGMKVPDGLSKFNADDFINKVIPQRMLEAKRRAEKAGKKFNEKDFYTKQAEKLARELTGYSDTSKYGMNAYANKGMGVRLPETGVTGEMAMRLYNNGNAAKGQIALSNAWMNVFGGDFDADTFRWLSAQSLSDFESYDDYQASFGASYDKADRYANLLGESSREILEAKKAKKSQPTDQEAQAELKNQIKKASDPRARAVAEQYRIFNKPLVGSFSNVAQSAREALSDLGVGRGYTHAINALLGTPEEEAISAKHAIEKNVGNKEEQQAILESAQDIKAYQLAMAKGADNANIEGLLSLYKQAGFLDSDGSKDYVVGKRADNDAANILAMEKYLKQDVENGTEGAQERLNDFYSQFGATDEKGFSLIRDQLKLGRIDTDIIKGAYQRADASAKANGFSNGIMQMVKSRGYRNGAYKIDSDNAVSGVSSAVLQYTKQKGLEAEVISEPNNGVAAESQAISAGVVNITANVANITSESTQSVQGQKQSNQDKVDTSKTSEDQSVSGSKLFAQKEIKHADGSITHQYGDSVISASAVANRRFGNDAIKDYETGYTQTTSTEYGNAVHYSNQYYDEIYRAAEKAGISEDVLKETNNVQSLFDTIKEQYQQGIISDDDFNKISAQKGIYEDNMAKVHEALEGLVGSDEAQRMMASAYRMSSNMIDVENSGQFGRRVASEVGLSGNFGGTEVGAQLDKIFYDPETNTLNVLDYKTGKFGAAKTDLQTSIGSHSLEDMYNQYVEAAKASPNKSPEQIREELRYQMIGQDIKDGKIEDAQRLNNVFDELMLVFEQMKERAETVAASFGVIGLHGNKQDGSVDATYLNRLKRDATVKGVKKAENGDDAFTKDQQEQQNYAAKGRIIKFKRTPDSGKMEEEQPDSIDASSANNKVINEAISWQKKYNAAELRVARTQQLMQNSQGDKKGMATLQKRLEAEQQLLGTLNLQRVQLQHISDDQYQVTRMVQDQDGNWKTSSEAITLTKEQAAKYNKEMQSISATQEANVAKVQTQTKSIGTYLQSVLGGMKQTMQYLTRTSLVYGAIGKIKQSFSTLINTVKQLNAQLVKLEIASGSAGSQVKNSLKDYNELAERLGKTTVEAAEAASDWLRAGYRSQEAAKLVESSLKLSTLGQIEAKEATTDLISALKGWKLGSEDVAGVVDELTALDTKFATTAGDIANAMAKANVSASLGGMDRQTYEAMLTTVMDVGQQGSDVVGTAKLNGRIKG